MFRNTFLVILMLMSWTVASCSGSLTVDDDDTAAMPDDDAADDDAADDDVADDDAADDDVADDDAADDDASDDDTGDDDTADDDDSMPAQPGIEFSVPTGQLAGDYAFHVDAWCGPDDGWLAEAADNGIWDQYLVLWLPQFPTAGSHHEQTFWVGGWMDGIWVDVDHGGPDCYLDVLGDAPLWGTFECAGLHGWEHHANATADLEDGVFRCP